jgi:hypothetical protein
MDMGTDALERARRLLARIMARRLQTSFLTWKVSGHLQAAGRRWRGSCTGPHPAFASRGRGFADPQRHVAFERLVKELSTVVDPVSDALEKMPENRTPEDVQRLLPMVSKVAAGAPPAAAAPRTRCLADTGYIMPWAQFWCWLGASALHPER